MTDPETSSPDLGVHEASLTNEALERARLAVPLSDACQVLPVEPGRGGITEKTRQRIKERYLGEGHDPAEVEAAIYASIGAQAEVDDQDMIPPEPKRDSAGVAQRDRLFRRGQERRRIPEPEDEASPRDDGGIGYDNPGDTLKDHD